MAKRPILTQSVTTAVSYIPLKLGISYSRYCNEFGFGFGFGIGSSFTTDCRDWSFIGYSFTLRPTDPTDDLLLGAFCNWRHLGPTCCRTHSREKSQLSAYRSNGSLRWRYITSSNFHPNPSLTTLSGLWPSSHSLVPLPPEQDPPAE